jgi:hypothetical protein
VAQLANIKSPLTEHGWLGNDSFQQKDTPAYWAQIRTRDAIATRQTETAAQSGSRERGGRAAIITSFSISTPTIAAAWRSLRS